MAVTLKIFLKHHFLNTPSHGASHPLAMLFKSMTLHLKIL